MKEIYNELIKKIDKTKIALNEPMYKHTTFKIGGPADLFVRVENLEELKYAINIIKENNINLSIIGNGSNILVKDRRNKGSCYKTRF